MGEPQPARQPSYTRRAPPGLCLFAYFSARFLVVRLRPMKTRGEFCSARSFIFVRFEEAVGKLRIAYVADDLLRVIL